MLTPLCKFNVLLAMPPRCKVRWPAKWESQKTRVPKFWGGPCIQNPAVYGSVLVSPGPISGLLSNQGEKSINPVFHNGSIKTKVLKYGTPKPSSLKPPEASPPSQTSGP